MPEMQSIDPKNGFCSETKIFHSLRPPVPFPPLSQPISIFDYTLSLLRSSSTATAETTFLIDATTGVHLTYSEFFSQVRSLSVSLLSQFPSLSKNDVAFILSPPTLHVPVLYFSLLSLGVTVSPANPLSTPSELTHLLKLCKPAIAFTISSLADKFPTGAFPIIHTDSPRFLSMMSVSTGNRSFLAENFNFNFNRVINQSDTAAILYSSGTTGRVKGVELTHRNLIAVISTLYHNKYIHSAESTVEEPHPVSLFTLPLFHVFGFFMFIRAASLGESLVLMGRFDFEKMLETIQKYKVTYMPVSPPLVVALAKSDLVSKYDLSSLLTLGCGGAPLGKEVSEHFNARFPSVEIIQVRAFHSLSPCCGVKDNSPKLIGSICSWTVYSGLNLCP